jgi:hypothetical protein
MRKADSRNILIRSNDAIPNISSRPLCSSVTHHFLRNLSTFYFKSSNRLVHLARHNQDTVVPQSKLWWRRRRFLKGTTIFRSTVSARKIKEAATGTASSRNSSTTSSEAASVEHGVTGAGIVATAVPATSHSPTAPACIIIHLGIGISRFNRRTIGTFGLLDRVV